MLLVGMFGSGSVDDSVVWSDDTEEGADEEKTAEGCSQASEKGFV